MKKSQITKLVVSALLMAIGMVLPFLTGQIAQLGSMLLPMHLPVLICGFVCGGGWGAGVGFVLPLLRSLTLGMPPMMPTALCMAFELAAYGAAAGVLYARLPQRTGSVYAALAASMLFGRVVWGVVSFAVYALFTEKSFGLAAFWTGGFVRAWPGMALQVALVPPIVFALQKTGLIPIKD